MNFQRPSNTMNSRQRSIGWFSITPDVLHGVVVFGEHHLAPVGGVVAVQQRQQRAAFQDVVRRRAAEIVDEGRRQVDRLDQRVADGAARAVGGRRRIDHDQRDLCRLLVEQILLAHPVIAEIVAMVGREHDHRGVEQAARFEELHQHAHLVVDLLDQAHIGRDDFFARLVARHVAGIAHVHVGGEHRMRVGALLLRADHRASRPAARTCWRRVPARCRASAA